MKLDHKYALKLGQWLKERRKEKGYRQIDVGLKSGFLCNQFISSLERGSHIPGPDVMKRIRKALGIHKRELAAFMAALYSEAIREVYLERDPDRKPREGGANED